MKENDTQESSFAENIQLRIDQLTYNILKSDSEYFQFKGLNTLINQVVSSFAFTYISKFEENLLSIKIILERYGVAPSIKEDIARDLLVDKFRGEDNTLKKDRAIKIHVNSSNESDFLYLYQKTAFYNNQVGFPEVVRSILYEYCKLSKAQREIILFSDTYEKIQNALSNKIMLELYLADKSVVQFNPYAFMNPLDDEGNYLFGEYDDSSPYAIPLHKIKKTIHLSSSSKISNKTIQLYQDTISTKFNYKELSELASDNILETVRMLKSLSYLLGNNQNQ